MSVRWQQHAVAAPAPECSVHSRHGGFGLGFAALGQSVECSQESFLLG